MGDGLQVGPLLTTGPPVPQPLFAVGSHPKTGEGQVGGQGWMAGARVDEVDR